MDPRLLIVLSSIVVVVCLFNKTARKAAGWIIVIAMILGVIAVVLHAL